jgi:hypothetical protein
MFTFPDDKAYKQGSMYTCDTVRQYTLTCFHVTHNIFCWAICGVCSTRWASQHIQQCFPTTVPQNKVKASAKSPKYPSKYSRNFCPAIYTTGVIPAPLHFCPAIYTTAVIPAPLQLPLLLCSRISSSSRKEKLFHRVFRGEKVGKHWLTELQLNRKSAVIYIVLSKYTMCSGLHAMNITDRMQCPASSVTLHTGQYSVYLPRRDNATLLCQQCDTTHRTTQHG